MEIMELENTIIPLIAVAIFIGTFILVRIRNPHNQKIETRINPKDIFRKEICPYCGIKMKKTWKKRILYGSDKTRRVGYEKTAQFTCEKCNYKI